MQTSKNSILNLSIRDICGLLDITMHGIEDLSNNKAIAALVNNIARTIVANVAVSEDGSINPCEADIAIRKSLDYADK